MTYQNASKFVIFLLGHFIKHRPLIFEVYMTMFFSSLWHQPKVSWNRELVKNIYLINQVR